MYNPKWDLDSLFTQNTLSETTSIPFHMGVLPLPQEVGQTPSDFTVSNKVKFVSFVSHFLLLKLLWSCMVSLNHIRRFKQDHQSQFEWNERKMKIIIMSHKWTKNGIQGEMEIKDICISFLWMGPHGWTMLI